MEISKRKKVIFMVIFVALGAMNRCDCNEESLEVPSEVDIVGTWILKNAQFSDDDVDLDGDGPMSPIKDIKSLLLDLLNVYATCSSIEEMPIRFSNDIASPATSSDPTNKYSVYAVCPAGQGITNQIGVYYMDPYRENAFYLEVDELNDPANLIDWGGNFHIFITDDIIADDGLRTIFGTSSLIPNGSSSYRQFDFIFEEYTEG